MTERPVGRPKKWDPNANSEITEEKCPKCGKIFCPAPYHVYKDSKGLYCSWTCYSHRKEKE